MRLFARELPLRPEPLSLARRLRSEPEVSFLWSASHRGPSFLAARPIGESSALDPEPGLPFRQPGGGHESVPRWIGALPYEGCRHLERPDRVPARDERPLPHVQGPIWRRYGAVARIDERVTVIGDDEASVRRLTACLMDGGEVEPRPTRIELREVEAEVRHAERIRRALELIAAGELYQVNLARRFELDVAGAAVDLLQRLCAETRPAYAAALQFGEVVVLSTSPELFLEQSPPDRVLTQPIKGTRPRGRDAVSDARLASELAADEKERAELSMIVDVERNDLGRVCRIGTVRVLGPPSIESQGLVWHRHARVSGRLAEGLTREDLLRAMLPSGSVTGAPKVRAMEIIAGLEAHRRGLYTGALGYLSHAGQLELAMAIRTLTAVGGVGHYFAGGGIVADSDPAREVRETAWKSRQLFGRTGELVGAASRARST